MALVEIEVSNGIYFRIKKYRFGTLKDVRSPRVVMPGDDVKIKAANGQLLQTRVESVEGSDVQGAITLAVKLVA